MNPLNYMRLHDPSSGNPRQYWTNESNGKIRTLRTVWTEQPTNCAMGFGDSRRALARTIWARRTRKASAVRRSASHWRRSSFVKGRIKSGGFIAQVYKLEAQLHKNSCGDALGADHG